MATIVYWVRQVARLVRWASTVLVHILPRLTVKLALTLPVVNLHVRLALRIILVPLRRFLHVMMVSSVMLVLPHARLVQPGVAAQRLGKELLPVLRVIML
jgi:hypothetical protein